MIRNLLICISVIIFSTSGCVRETYDMDNLSRNAHLSPIIAISAVKGNISISDLVEPTDTIVYDEDNFIRFVFRKDSVIDFVMKEFYDLDSMVSFTEVYPIGDMILSPFTGSIIYTLDAISRNLSSSLRTQFLALDGKTGNFPPFSSTPLDPKVFSFSNFEYALFKEGTIDIRIENNLTAPLSGVSIRLYNTAGYEQIGTEGVISSINPGTSGTTSINLAGETVRNSITAEVTIIGSPGASNVFIDLDDSNIEITLAGNDLRVTSGRVILPEQILPALENDDADTIPFDPGDDVEIDFIKINSGDLSYKVVSGSLLTSDISLILPTTLQGSAPINTSFVVGPVGTETGIISADNAEIDLGTVASQPYNMLPINYVIRVSSGNTMVNFNSEEEISIDIELVDPDFDFVKGYFGQQTETIEEDTLDLEIKEIIDHISGSFLISDPSVTLSYANSFSVPLEMNLQAVGQKQDQIVPLELEPVRLGFPAAPAERDREDSYTIGRENSNLPELISLPPEKITFSGSAVMNPDGNDGSRNNYIFGNSRFLGNLEIDIPMEIRISSLQFTDTTKNFLQMDDTTDALVNTEDFEFMRIKIEAENGFPLDVSISLVLYDSVGNNNLYTIDANDIIEPAPVDADGKVTAPASSSTTVDITREFWENVNSADKIIFKFTLITTGNGSRDVKIYSDYKINFRAALILKPDIKFDL